MIGTLDSSAMIAYLRQEPGGNFVANLLEDDQNTWYAHAVNLCEVYYDFHRAFDEQTALGAIEDLLHVGVLPRTDMDDAFWQEAGRLKSVHRRVSLADCFCITLARRVGGEIVTGDHHEFDRIAPLGLCSVRFIR